MMLVDYEDSDSDNERNDEEKKVDSVDSVGVTTSLPSSNRTATLSSTATPSTHSTPTSSSTPALLTSLPKPQPPPPRKIQPLIKKGQDGVISIALPLPAVKKRKQDKGAEEGDDGDSSDEDAGLAHKRTRTAGVSLTSLLPPPKNSVASKPISFSPPPSASSSTPVASILSRTRLLPSEASPATTTTTSSPSLPSSSVTISTARVATVALPPPSSVQSEQAPTVSYFSATEPEPTPEFFLPKHLRDTFSTDQAKVVEIKQADLRGTGLGSISLPPVISSGGGGGGPKASSVQKKKHQISYLASEAMAKEAELAEKRAAGLKAKTQVRSKYGW